MTMKYARAKYPGVCRLCHQSFNIGDEIELWNDVPGWCHARDNEVNVNICDPFNFGDDNELDFTQS